MPTLWQGEHLMLEGLMQHDVPMSLQHAFDRMHGMHGQAARS